MIGLKLGKAYGPPLLTWTGPTNGTQDMKANPVLYFVAAPGTYMITVQGEITLSWEICGNGAYGGNGGIDANGGNGGGCGEVRSGNVVLVPGTTYHLGLQGANVNGNSFIAVLGGPAIVAAGGTGNRNAPVPTNIGALVFPGRIGGQGGQFVTVAPDGDSGTYSGAYSPGSGGGGGCGGGASLGHGGDGGGRPGSGDPPQDPGHGPPGAGGTGGTGIGWRGFAIGAGGGGGASANNNPISGGPTPGRAGYNAGAVAIFVA